MKLPPAGHPGVTAHQAVRRALVRSAVVLLIAGGVVGTTLVRQATPTVVSGVVGLASLLALALPALYAWVFRPAAVQSVERAAVQHLLEESESFLRQAEEKYRQLFAEAPHGIYQSSLAGELLTANAAMARILGYESVECLMTELVDVSRVYAAADGRSAFQREMAKDGVVRNLEFEVVRKDGSRRWVSENARQVRDAAGAVRYYEGTLTDISDRKLSEEAARLFRVLIDHSMDAIQVVDPDTLQIVDANATAWLSLGYTRDEFLALNIADLDSAGSVDKRNVISDRLQRMGVAMFETAHRRKDGSTLPVEVNITRVSLDRDYAIVVARDITERKSAESMLHLQAGALNAAANPIVITDRQGTIVWVNTAFSTALGYGPEEAIGRNPRELVKSGVHDRAFYKNLWDTVLAGDVWQGEMVNRRKDGTRYSEDMTITPILNAEGAVTHFIAIKLDITERKHRDAKLLEQAELLDRARDAIIVCDLAHRITYWNRSAERTFGWAAAEALGAYSPELMCVDPGQFEAAHAQLLRQGEWAGELRMCDRQARHLIIDSRWTLVRDQEGHPSHVLVIDTDITERKQLELQFLRAQRLESIGTLAGGIAHDLNNVLGPILLSIDVLRLKVDDADNRALVEAIRVSAERGADIVGQVLSFARGLEGRRVEVQIRHLTREIEKLAKETFPKSIRVLNQTNRDLWTVIGDPTQLHQVLLNLCINARDAMPTGGELSIIADNVTFDEADAARHISARVGLYVLIKVRDTGTGIPPSIIDKVFDPFFTTKEVGKGTGLGLATSLSIVKQHAGFISVSSTPGQGTEFQIYLPAEANGRTEELDETERELPRGAGEIVLIVDDEAAIREIVRQTLETFGYRVLLAAEGAEAVSIYAQQGDAIGAVIVDLMMPGMDGVRTIQVLAKMNPRVRVIAMSGRASALEKLPTVSHGSIGFLAKPFTAESLLVSLHALLAPESDGNPRLFE